MYFRIFTALSVHFCWSDLDFLLISQLFHRPMREARTEILDQFEGKIETGTGVWKKAGCFLGLSLSQGVTVGRICLQGIPILSTISPHAYNPSSNVTSGCKKTCNMARVWVRWRGVAKRNWLIIWPDLSHLLRDPGISCTTPWS
jgi:hypothetical protein